MQVSFEGTWVPIVTPFVDRAGTSSTNSTSDAIDHAALTRLARHLAGQGIAGLVVGATTGEGALLAPGEQEALFATLRTAVPALPLVLGVSQASTAAAVQQARSLATLRPDGLLVTPPPYVRPSQEGIRRHFEAVVAATGLDLLVYNIPYRIGVSVEVETLQQLARDPRVRGIKECGGSLERMARLLAETPLRVLAGDDSQNFAALCLGAHGVIAASAHLQTHWHVRMQALIAAGDLPGARRIAQALQPLVALLFAEPNPAPLKTLLAQQDWCSAQVRLPFLPATAALRARLLQAWQDLPTLA